MRSRWTISVLNAPENNNICTEMRLLNTNKIYYLTNSFSTEPLRPKLQIQMHLVLTNGFNNRYTAIIINKASHL